MDTPVVVAVALVAVVGGAVLGWLLRSLWASQTMKAAQSEARRIEAEARAHQKELILEAKDEKLRHAARGRGRGPRQAQRALEPRAAPPRAGRAARPAHGHARAARPQAPRARARARQDPRGARPRPPGAGRGARARLGHVRRGRQGASCSRRSARRPSTTRSSSPAPSSDAPARRPRTRPATSSSPRCSAWPRTTRPSTRSRSCTCRPTR